MQHKQEQQQQQQQPQQMGYGGGGLSRFKSAPVSWFDSLLEQTDDEVPSQQIPQQTQTQTQTQTQAQPQIQTQTQTQTQTHQCVSQLPTLRNSGVYDPTTLFDTCSSSSSFTRHNSSPPELLANLISPPPHTILASDDGGVASNYDILSFLDIPPTSTKVETESDPTQLSQLKGEQSGNFSDMEMEMEKLFQDSVPCRVRAKRGFATHPRSIAERVRRTRISDRIRKLQELVPNMDKQTNTADMLEEAVEYVKFLQNQIQELNEHQRNCKCLGRE